MNHSAGSLELSQMAWIERIGCMHWYMCEFSNLRRYLMWIYFMIPYLWRISLMWRSHYPDEEKVACMRIKELGLNMRSFGAATFQALLGCSYFTSLIQKFKLSCLNYFLPVCVLHLQSYKITDRLFWSFDILYTYLTVQLLMFIPWLPTVHFFE